MIHELIDQKKKTNRTTSSKNTRAFQDPKTISQEINFEASDSENKSSSTIFIPPWLRNSLGLNQRNNLSHAAGGSDLKSGKLTQGGKEQSQNELESLKTDNLEQDCCKKLTDHFEISPQEVNSARGPGDAETVDNNEKGTSVYWDVRCKESEAEWSCRNTETKPFKIEDSKMTATDVFTSAEIEKLKEEDKKRLKLMKQKHKLRKRLLGESKQSDLDKNEMDLLLEMKAREALENYMKAGDVHSVSSEMRNLEAKLLLLSTKSRNLSNSKLNQQELQMLHEIKNQAGSADGLERIFEHVKDVNLRGVVRNPEFLSKSAMEKKRDDKDEKCGREAMQKGNDDGKFKGDKDSLLSTDDENDIKRFSEFLNKNKNLDEKRKCLEEVRNYFERKRRTRLTKRRCLEETKPKPSPDGEKKEEPSKEKIKPREVYRGRRSKFALCDEEVVEKAVDEALQKFVELYNFRVSPSIMGSMKKNILQAIATDSLDVRGSKLNESASLGAGGKEINLDVLNPTEKGTEKVNAHPFMDAETTGVPNRELVLAKEPKKKNIKSLNETLDEQASNLVPEQNVIENEKLKRLKKEFDVFLNSIQNHIDVTNLKLQSIILEKEEPTISSRNVQFVYNFTKKALEPEKTDYWQSLKEVLDLKNSKDVETQTAPDMEPSKRSVKIQALEQKCSCEQELQTEDKIYVTQHTQTDDEGMTVREIKELKSYDVNPGLYRMVRSKEAGKFYLYPEQLNDDAKQDVCEKSNSSVVRDRKLNKRRNLTNLLSKERTKERQVFFRDRDRIKAKKSRKSPVYALARVRGDSTKERKNSISCLYFRNFDKKGSGSVSSKKDVDYTDENLTGRQDMKEEMRIGDVKEDHLGCFWFWNGEKIGPGCDLKTHVENLLKEKLTQIANVEGKQSGTSAKDLSLSKNQDEQLLLKKASLTNVDIKNANAIFCFSNVKDVLKENPLAFENENLEENKGSLVVEDKGKNEEVEETLVSVSQDKSVRNVATQNSRMEFLSLNLSRVKTQSGTATTVKRRCTRRNLYIKPAHKKLVDLKTAEDFLRAVEEIKNMKLEFTNSKKENSTDSESLLDCSTSTSGSKDGTVDPLSLVLGLRDGLEGEEMSNSDIKNKLKKFIGLVDREVQTIDFYDVEDTNSVESQAVGSTLDRQKHLDLIGSVLSRGNHKERESLWNDLRDFIKTKIGRDINDEGAKEVCIEIEQDMPKNEEGRMKHSIMTKGHYTKNEGDVEVEIDMTLEDLAKILRQRQRRIRRRNLYRSSKSKNFLSSSSAQSDFNKDDLRRYQKYLHRFAALGEDLLQQKDSKAFKKNTAN